MTKRYKFMAAVSTVFLTLLTLAAAMNLLVGDTQPHLLKDLSGIICFSAFIIGLWAQKRLLLLGLPALSLISLGISFANAHNFASVVGGIVGACLPIALTYWFWKQCSQNSGPKHSEAQKISEAS